MAAWSRSSAWPASSPPVLVQRTRLLPQLLTRTGAPICAATVAHFKSVRRPASRRNGGPLRVGLGGPLQSDFAGRDVSARPKLGRDLIEREDLTHFRAPGLADTSGRDGNLRIEQLARLQHRMHDHCEFARNRDRGPLEADLLLELQAPAAQRAFRPRSRQDHRRRLRPTIPQMIVSAPRDLAVIIDLA